MRSDTISTMRRDSSTLATFVREQIEGPEGTEEEVSILRGWTAWKVSVASGEAFGARSFGILALDIIFNTTRKIDTGAHY
jgi:RNA-dependent RNA polymerase